MVDKDVWCLGKKNKKEKAQKIRQCKYDVEGIDGTSR